MFTNRNKLSALALGTLLSISALQPALAADVTERADAKASKWLEQQLQITDGSPMPAFQDRPASAYQGASMTVPQRADINASKWLEQQLQSSDGSPTPAFHDRPISDYQGASMTVSQSADTEASKWLEQQLRITDGQ